KLRDAIKEDAGLSDARRTLLNAYADEAMKYRQDTQTLQIAGEELGGIAAGVARTLVNHVDTVIGKINNAIRETTPNVQAVASTIAGLSVLQPKAMPSPSTPKTPDAPPKVTVPTPGPPARGRTEEALENVKTSIQAAAPLAAIVRAAVVKSQYTKATPTIASC